MAGATGLFGEQAVNGDLRLVVGGCRRVDYLRDGLVVAVDGRLLDGLVAAEVDGYGF